jgi:DNA-directed RNA polymerase specialized sigma24 family protein
MWQTARNQVIDEIRRRVRNRALAVRETGGEATVSGPTERLEREDCLRVVREAARSLRSGRARRCLEMWLDGRDPLAIAAELGLAPGQVRGLLQRARDEVILRASSRLKGLR